MRILQQWLELPYAHSSHRTAFLSLFEDIGIDLPVWIRIYTSRLRRVPWNAFLDALCKQYKIIQHDAYVITR